MLIKTKACWSRIISVLLIIGMIVLIASATPRVSLAATSIDTFENDVTGQAPSGYTVVGANAVVSETVAYGGDKSLRIYDDSSSVVAQAVKTDTASLAKTLEFMIYPVAATYSNQIDIASGANSNNNSVFHLGIFSDGTMKYYNGSSWIAVSTSGAITFNAWNEIRIEAGSTTSADIYINDSFAGAAGKWQSFSSMDRVRFMSGSTAGTGDDFYIDDVSFGSPEIDPVILSGMDTFEDDITGQAPYGYTIVGANAVVSETVAFEGNKSLRLYDDSSTVVTNAVRLGNPSPGKILELMIYPVAATYWNQIDINSGGNDNNQSVFHIGIEGDGRVKWYNGSSWTYIGAAGTVTFNAWNKIYIFAADASNADVYVNDNFIGTAGHWHSATSLDRVRFMSGSTAGTGDDFYIDNISFEDYAEPEDITVGYLDSDTTPQSGTVGNWASTNPCAVDYQRRSVGIDCGQMMDINKIELWDSDSTTRCTANDYTLYFSNDNSNYTQITDIDFTFRVSGGRTVHTFNFSGVHARYYKVNTTFSDSNSTFNLNNLQQDIKAYGSPTSLNSTVGYMSNDTAPESSAVGNWGYSSNLSFDYQNRSIGIDLGSQIKVNKVVLTDSDGTNRCTQSKYNLYWSNDNNTYTKIQGFVLNTLYENNRKEQVFEFSGIQARYIKIKTTYSDTASDFLISNLQDDVKAYALTDTNYKLPLTGGYIVSDNVPATTGIGSWGESSPVAVDNLQTSVGIDLGYALSVNTVELWDSNDDTTVEETDYSLYQSNDNINYSEITDWDFATRIENNRTVHRFDFNSIATRYIKVHCDVSGSDSTFVLNDASTDIKAYSNVEAESFSAILDPSRNSEGDVIRLNNGNLLMVFETYEAGTGDWDPSHLEGRISTDGGYTWGNKFIVLNNEGSINTMKASLLRMENGDIALFYQVMDSLSDCKMYMRRSSDEGQTWGSRTCVTSSPAGYYILNNGRVTRLSSGRILIPVCYAANRDAGQGGSGAVSRCYYSDDDGYTWTMGTGYVQLPNGALEPGVTELTNGDILMNMRTRVVGKIYKSLSTDGGITWSSPADMGFTTASAPSTIVRIPATGDLVLFYNSTFSTTNNPRNPLTVVISKDEGQTWINPKNLDEKNSTNDMFAYLSCRFVGRQVLLTYTENWQNKFRIVDVGWFYSKN